MLMVVMSAPTRNCVQQTPRFVAIYPLHICTYKRVLVRQFISKHIFSLFRLFSFLVNYLYIKSLFYGMLTYKSLSSTKHLLKDLFRLKLAHYSSIIICYYVLISTCVLDINSHNEQRAPLASLLLSSCGNVKQYIIVFWSK